MCMQNARRRSAHACRRLEGACGGITAADGTTRRQNAYARTLVLRLASVCRGMMTVWKLHITGVRGIAGLMWASLPVGVVWVIVTEISVRPAAHMLLIVVGRKSALS